MSRGDLVLSIEASVLGLWGERREKDTRQSPTGHPGSCCIPVSTYSCPSRKAQASLPVPRSPPEAHLPVHMFCLVHTHPWLYWRPWPDPDPRTVLVWPALWPERPQGLCSQLAAK